PSRRSSAVCEREWRARPVRGLKAPETFRRLQPRARLHCRPSRNALPPERARSGLWRCDRSTIEAPYGCRDGSFLRQKRAFSNEAGHQAGKRASGVIVCLAGRSAKRIRSQGCAKGAPPSARAWKACPEPVEGDAPERGRQRIIPMRCSHREMDPGRRSNAACYSLLRPNYFAVTAKKFPVPRKTGKVCATL